MVQNACNEKHYNKSIKHSIVFALVREHNVYIYMQ